jgi:FixJ family two-component response regulator
MATVHLIDDDGVCRAALGRVLGAAGYDVRTYAAAGDYLVPDPDGEPGCLVLDLHMPGVDGLELQAALRRHPGYDRPIIFLSGTADVRASVRAMNAGARDFLVKPVDESVLLAAVRDAVESDAQERELQAQAQLARERIASLSGRERKVLQAIASGLLHKQIASDLGVSERTVKADRARIKRRLGVESLASLLKLLIDAGGGRIELQ